MIRYLKHLQIKTKLMLLGMTCILLTTISIVVVGAWQGLVFSKKAQDETIDTIKDDLKHVTAGIYNLIKAQDESIQQKVNHDLKVAQHIFNDTGKAWLSDETITWAAVNQYTKEQKQLSLPKMMVGPDWLGQNRLIHVETPVVDYVKRLVGGTATIFQRINPQGDILRVATNVEKKDGNRAIGTYIPALNPDGSPNPVVSTVMRGETYQGIAYVVNAWYVTAYAPIFDYNGNIIGVLYVGVKQENISSLRQGIMDVQIGKTGSVLISRGKGGDRGEVIISPGGRWDGLNLWEATDARGEKTTQSIVQKAIACKPGEFAFERYLYQDPREPQQARWKLVCLAYYEPWDWVIGANAYEDEILQPIDVYRQGYWSMIRVFFWVALVTSFFGTVAIGMFTNQIAHTLNVVTRAADKLTQKDLPRLVQTMNAANQGDLTVAFEFNTKPVKVSSYDELGKMAQAFTRMNSELVKVGGAFTLMVANLRQLTGNLEKRVTERTEELKASEQKMADIIDFLPYPTLVIDKHSKVMAWNRAMEKLTGVPSDEMIGKGDYAYAQPLFGKQQPILIDLVRHPNPEREAQYKGFKKEEKTLYGETSSTHLKDELVHLSGAATALYDSSGDKVGAIQTVRDISERKAVENALVEAKRQAEEAAQAKSEFLANMSHEIRTPMNGVIGMAGLLLDTELTSEQRRYSETIRVSGDALLTLINDILDFSKIEAKKLDLETIDFNLQDILDDISEMLAFRAHEKGLELTYFITSEVPVNLTGDPGRLRQIIINLLGNAVKFTPDGEVTIWGDLVEEDDVSVTIRFSIVDTGIGISPEKLSDLFSPFTQADGSNTRKYGGTGLGLTISKNLAELMGGTIGVESELGKGSNFWFTVVFQKQGKKTVSAKEQYEDLQGNKVLIVDDNQTNRLLLSTLLRSWGCACAEAKDGEKALEMLSEAARSKKPFQIALLDMQMPGMDGVTLGTRIKKDPLIKDTVMLMLTSLGHASNPEHLNAIGFADCISKPIRRRQLLDCMLSALGKKIQSRLASSPKPVALSKTMLQLKSRIRILVVDDLTTNQEVATAILKKLGCRTDAVANGREALAALHDIPYNLVFMDCQMPEMDGYETTRRIRNSPPGICPADIPIVAMTAHAMKGDRERCLQAGMNDYITKPVTPMAVSHILEQWLINPLHQSQTAETTAKQQHLDEYQETATIKTDLEVNDGIVQTEQAPIFDPGLLIERLMGDEALAATIIAGFLSDLPKQIKRLKTAVKDEDCGLAEQQAHKIKSAAGNIGGIELEQTACAIEYAGKAGDVKEVVLLTAQLEAQFESLENAIDTSGR